MCQSLVERVARSKQLMAVSDPDLLVLFEDWLDELEAEVISLAQSRETLTPQDLATQARPVPPGGHLSHLQAATGRKIVLTALRSLWKTEEPLSWPWWPSS